MTLYCVARRNGDFFRQLGSGGVPNSASLGYSPLIPSSSSRRRVVPSSPEARAARIFRAPRVRYRPRLLYIGSDAIRRDLDEPSPMHQRDIVFYDPTRNEKCWSAVKKTTSILRKKRESEVNELI